MVFSKYKLWATCSLLVTACSSFDAEHLNDVVIIHEAGGAIVSDAPILDVPQNLGLFISQIDEKSLKNRQKELNKKFDEVFFSPWRGNIEKVFPESFSGNYFGENLHKLSRKEIEYIRSNIKYRTSVERKGIIVRNTMVKSWPTNSQLFSNLKNPGDSYPFDSNIQSLMRLGTPVKITAVSNDGLWAFVSSHAFSGWVSRHDVACVDKQFIKKYMSHQKMVATKDGIVIKYKDKFLNRADIGTVLVRDKKGLLCPYKNFDGFAKLIRCNASGFTKKPFAFTSENAVKIAEQFLDQKYGWEGYLNLRDCSMLTMDYFTTFGVLLRRNSKAQLSPGCPAPI